MAENTPARGGPVPTGEPLDSTDDEFDAAAQISPEDIARAMDAAPQVLRPYLEAPPADEEGGDA